MKTRDFSKKEIKLLHYFAVEDYDLRSKSAVEVYVMAIINAFVRNENNSYNTSLRNIFKSIKKHEFRTSPLYDIYIQLEE